MIYQTIDIKLGAVLLCEIPDARLLRVNGDIINSKKIIEVDYPVEYEGALKKVATDYTRKVQLVNVFQYNRALCLIRDALRGNTENGDRLQTRGIGHGAA